MDGTDEFNSDDRYIYYCGQQSFRRNGVAIIVNKRVQNAVLGCNLKNESVTDSMDMSLNKLWQFAEVHGVAKSWSQLSD